MSAFYSTRLRSGWRHDHRRFQSSPAKLSRVRRFVVQSTSMSRFRSIPSIEQLRQRQAMRELEATYGRAAVVDALRAEASAIRDAAAPSRTVTTWSMETMEAAVRARLDADHAPSLVAVINATGVIVHTNLGRAPLAAVATARVAALASGYTNLEYDLAKGGRGRRDVARRAADLPADRRRGGGCRQQQCGGDARLAGGPRCRTRGDHLPRRARRDRRWVPSTRRHEAVRSDLARGRHDQSDAGLRLRGGDFRSNGAAPPRAPLQLHHRRIHGASSARRTDRPREALQPPRGRGSRQWIPGCPDRARGPPATSPRSPTASPPA